MKYSVLIINEDGIYQTVASGVSGKLAGAIKKEYLKRGVWVQVKKEERNA